MKSRSPIQANLCAEWLRALNNILFSGKACSWKWMDTKAGVPRRSTSRVLLDLQVPKSRLAPIQSPVRFSVGFILQFHRLFVLSNGLTLRDHSDNSLETNKNCFEHPHPKRKRRQLIIFKRAAWACSMRAHLVQSPLCMFVCMKKSGFKQGRGGGVFESRLFKPHAVFRQLAKVAYLSHHVIIVIVDAI